MGMTTTRSKKIPLFPFGWPQYETAADMAAAQMADYGVTVPEMHEHFARFCSLLGFGDMVGKQMVVLATPAQAANIAALLDGPATFAWQTGPIGNPQLRLEHLTNAQIKAILASLAF